MTNFGVLASKTTKQLGNIFAFEIFFFQFLWKNYINYIKLHKIKLK